MTETTPGSGGSEVPIPVTNTWCDDNAVESPIVSLAPKSPAPAGSNVRVSRHEAPAGKYWLQLRVRCQGDVALSVMLPNCTGSVPVFFSVRVRSLEAPTMTRPASSVSGVTDRAW